VKVVFHIYFFPPPSHSCTRQQCGVCILSGLLVMKDFSRCRFLFVSRLPRAPLIIKRFENMFRQLYTYIRGADIGGRSKTSSINLASAENRCCSEQAKAVAKKRKRILLHQLMIAYILYIYEYIYLLLSLLIVIIMYERKNKYDSINATDDIFAVYNLRTEGTMNAVYVRCSECGQILSIYILQHKRVDQENISQKRRDGRTFKDVKRIKII
jgi:hypothetical protein